MWPFLKETWNAICAFAGKHPFAGTIAASNFVMLLAFYGMAYGLTSSSAPYQQVAWRIVDRIGLGRTLDLPMIRDRIFDRKIDTTYGTSFVFSGKDKYQLRALGQQPAYLPFYAASGQDIRLLLRATPVAAKNFVIEARLHSFDGSLERQTGKGDTYELLASMACSLDINSHNQASIEPGRVQEMLRCMQRAEDVSSHIPKDPDYDGSRIYFIEFVLTDLTPAPSPAAAVPAGPSEVMLEAMIVVSNQHIDNLKMAWQ